MWSNTIRMEDPDHPTGGSAFPGITKDGREYLGMTLRDYFAGQAIAGPSMAYLIHGVFTGRSDEDAAMYAAAAYALADAMLRIREGNGER